MIWSKTVVLRKISVIIKVKISQNWLFSDSKNPTRLFDGAFILNFVFLNYFYSEPEKTLSVNNPIILILKTKFQVNTWVFKDEFIQNCFSFFYNYLQISYLVASIWVQSFFISASIFLWWCFSSYLPSDRVVISSLKDGKYACLQSNRICRIKSRIMLLLLFEVYFNR